MHGELGRNGQHVRCRVAVGQDNACGDVSLQVPPTGGATVLARTNRSTTVTRSLVQVSENVYWLLYSHLKRFHANKNKSVSGCFMPCQKLRLSLCQSPQSWPLVNSE